MEPSSDLLWHTFSCKLTPRRLCCLLKFTIFNPEFSVSMLLASGGANSSNHLQEKFHWSTKDKRNSNTKFLDDQSKSCSCREAAVYPKTRALIRKVRAKVDIVAAASAKTESIFVNLKGSRSDLEGPCLLQHCFCDESRLHRDSSVLLSFAGGTKSCNPTLRNIQIRLRLILALDFILF